MAGQATNIGLRPTQAVRTDFGEIMNQGLNRLTQNEERARLNEERKQKRNAEFEDKYGIDESLYVLEDTEFRTVDDATTEAVSLYRDRHYDVYKELKKDPNNIDLKKKMGKITNSVKRMRASHDKIKAIGEDYLAKMENDELSDVDEGRWREILEATDEGRLKVTLDENDNMQYLFYNKSGQLEEVMPYKDLIRGDVISRVNLDSELDGLVKRVGTDKMDSVSGGFIKSSNIFGKDQQQFVNQWIDSYVGNDEKSLEANPVLADLLNQATGGSSKKRSDFTEQERQFVKSYLMQQTRDRFNEEIKLRQLSTRGSGSGRNSKAPKSSEINIAFQGSEPKRDGSGNFVFTIATPVAIDPTKSDRKVDTIKADKQGNIVAAGEDRVKVKGVQANDSVEAVAKREGVETNMIEKLLSSDGSVQYYKRVPFSINSKDNSALINKIGNMFGVEDEMGLRNILYQDMLDKFGKDKADELIGQKTPQQPIAAPTEVKAESGTVYK